MRTHYYWEVGLLVALSCVAATLAADHHLYEVIFHIFHICNDDSGTQIKQCVDTRITVIRLVAFGSTVILAATNIFQHLHSEKKLVHWLLVSLHNTFFSDVKDLDNLSKEQSIYRVTCYKFYEFTWRPLVFCLIFDLILIVGLAVAFLYAEALLIKTTSLIMIFTGSLVISFFLLFIFDSWWFQYIKRIFIKDRRLRLRKNYLMGYSRYGYESGQKNLKPTTLPFLVDRQNNVFRMFVGKVFKSEKRFEECCDNHEINTFLSQIDIDQNKIDNLKSFVYESSEKNYEELKTYSAFKELDSSKRHYIKSFMEKTHTTAWDLFNVNDRKHCNHFVGFKVMDKGAIWGIVTIEILEETLVNNAPKSFLDILNKPKDEPWLEFNLTAFSEIFSKTINPTKSDINAKE